MLFGLFGCKDRPAPAAVPFAFTVEHVFYIKPPVDRVILVGTVDSGDVRPGDTLVVRCQLGPVTVTVDGIETIKDGNLGRATKGQQVGLRVAGITKDQPTSGDRVVSPGS